MNFEHQGWGQTTGARLGVGMGRGSCLVNQSNATVLRNAWRTCSAWEPVSSGRSPALAVTWRQEVAENALRAKWEVASEHTDEGGRGIIAAFGEPRGEAASE